MMLNDSSGDLAASRRGVVPLDPAFVNFLRADFHRGAYDVWLTVADRPIEEGMETLSKFFEDKEKAVLGAYSEAIDWDGEEDEEEEDKELLYDMPEEKKNTLLNLFIAMEAEMSSDVQHYDENEDIDVETWKFFEDKETVILGASSKSMGGDKDDEDAEEVLHNMPEERKCTLCKDKDAGMSSEIEHNAEDEEVEVAVETGKLLAREKKHARNEDVEVSVEGEQEGKKARMEERLLHNKGECVVSGETKSFI